MSGNERAMADLLLAFARERQLDCYEDDAGSSVGTHTGNIIIKYGDGGNTLFLSHMDTARSTAKLQPIIMDDRITSDATTVLGVDNRLGITALLSALEIICNSGSSGSGFTIAFTICEESTLAGSRFLTPDPEIKRAYAFDSSQRPGAFIIKAPGAKEFTINVHGKASHSGIAPEAGVNALQIAARAVANLPLGRIDDDSTMNIGPFHCDAATNVVPPRVTMVGEIRSAWNERADEIEAELLYTLNQAIKGTAATFNYESDWDFQPYSIDADAEVRIHLIQCLEKLDIEIRPIASFGGSDANVLNAKGIPTINLGIGAQNPHSNEEFVLFEDMINSTKIALELMQNEL